MDVQDDRLLLRPTEVSRLLSISRAQVYVLVSQGKLPAVRLGKSVRIVAGALTKLVEEAAVAGLSPESDR